MLVSMCTFGSKVGSLTLASKTDETLGETDHRTEIARKTQRDLAQTFDSWRARISERANRVTRCRVNPVAESFCDNWGVHSKPTHGKSSLRVKPSRFGDCRKTDPDFDALQQRHQTPCPHRDESFWRVFTMRCFCGTRAHRDHEQIHDELLANLEKSYANTRWARVPSPNRSLEYRRRNPKFTGDSMDYARAAGMGEWILSLFEQCRSVKNNLKRTSKLYESIRVTCRGGRTAMDYDQRMGSLSNLYFVPECWQNLCRRQGVQTRTSFFFPATRAIRGCPTCSVVINLPLVSGRLCGPFPARSTRGQGIV